MSAQSREDLETILEYAKIKYPSITEGAIEEIANLEAELSRLKARVSDAETVINKGVSLMPIEQLNEWSGVRSWLEDER